MKIGFFLCLVIFCVESFEKYEPTGISDQFGLVLDVSSDGLVAVVGDAGVGGQGAVWALQNDEIVRLPLAAESTGKYPADVLVIDNAGVTVMAKNYFSDSPVTWRRAQQTSNWTSGAVDKVGKLVYGSSYRMINLLAVAKSCNKMAFLDAGRVVIIGRKAGGSVWGRADSVSDDGPTASFTDDGTELVVGIPAKDRIYFFHEVTLTNWDLKHLQVRPDGWGSANEFGNNVVFSGNGAVVVLAGPPSVPMSVGVSVLGSPKVLLSTAPFTPSLNNRRPFAVSQTPDGTVLLLVGCDGGGTRAGSALLYVRDSMTSEWLETFIVTTLASLPGESSGTADYFGRAVALSQSGTVAVVSGSQSVYRFCVLCPSCSLDACPSDWPTFPPTPAPTNVPSPGPTPTPPTAAPTPMAQPTPEPTPVPWCSSDPDLSSSPASSRMLVSATFDLCREEKYAFSGNIVEGDSCGSRMMEDLAEDMADGKLQNRVITCRIGEACIVANGTEHLSSKCLRDRNGACMSAVPLCWRPTMEESCFESNYQDCQFVSGYKYCNTQHMRVCTPWGDALSAVQFFKRNVRTGSFLTFQDWYLGSLYIGERPPPSGSAASVVVPLVVVLLGGGMAIAAVLVFVRRRRLRLHSDDPVAAAGPQSMTALDNIGSKSPMYSKSGHNNETRQRSHSLSSAGRGSRSRARSFVKSRSRGTSLSKKRSNSIV